MTKAAEVRARLIGAWRLVSYETVEPKDRRGKPFGDAIGRLEYDEHGHMAGQVMRPDREPVKRGDGAAERVRAAYSGYLAYFGTFEVDPDGKSVVHHVEGSLIPEWVGGDQVRALRFEGDRLVLSAEVLKAGHKIKHVLTWERCSRR